MNIYAISMTDSPEARRLRINGSDEIFFCQTGGGYFRTEHAELSVTAGDVICVPAGTPHSDVLASRPLLQFSFSSNEPALHNFQIYHDSEGDFAGLLELVTRALNPRHSSPYWLAYTAGLGTMLHRLVQCWGEDEEQRPNHVILDLRDTIHRRSSDPNLDLRSEIQKTGYCDAYVRRLFKSFFGETPTNYLNQQRIGHAKSLLRSARRTVTIKQISQRAGFRDPYYFSRMFRKIEGVSPSIYLDQLDTMPE